MGIDDLVNKGKQFLDENKDKLEGVLRSEQAESVSDTVLDAGADFVKKLAPEQHHGAVDGVRANIDKAIGTE